MSGSQTRAIPFCQNPSFQKRLAVSILNFLTDLAFELINRKADVAGVAYHLLKDDRENASVIPPFEDLYHCAQTQDKLEAFLLVQLQDGRLLRTAFTLEWGKFTIASRFSNGPLDPGTNIYDFIREYAFPVHDTSREWNLVLMDTNEHHEVSTKPHHKHSYRRGVKDPTGQPFSGRLSSFADEICALNGVVPR